MHAGGRAGWFEVIESKSVTAGGEGKYAAFVRNYDKSKRRLYEVLKSQGLQLDQPRASLVTGATPRASEMRLSPQSEHLNGDLQRIFSVGIQ